MRWSRFSKPAAVPLLAFFAFCHLFFATYAVACAFHHVGAPSHHHQRPATHHDSLCNTIQCGGSAVVLPGQSSPADLPAVHSFAVPVESSHCSALFPSSAASRAPPPFSS
ncbi:MAG: hypothetical protein AB1515_10445 [Nitrospirota bacterium]